MAKKAMRIRMDSRGDAVRSAVKAKRKGPRMEANLALGVYFLPGETGQDL
jgi:hypothetical protein